MFNPYPRCKSITHISLLHPLLTEQVHSLQSTVAWPGYEGRGCLYGREAPGKMFGRKPHPLIKTRDWIIRI